MQKRKNQPIARPGVEHYHWFILLLLLATPTMQFLLDRKRRSHKQNQCSASDSVGSIFTKSYRSSLLITTPTTTPSLVKTSLQKGLFDQKRDCFKIRGNGDFKSATSQQHQGGYFAEFLKSV